MDLVSVDHLVRPRSRAEAHAALLDGATPLAGGTALHGMYPVGPTALVDLTDLGWTDVETIAAPRDGLEDEVVAGEPDGPDPAAAPGAPAVRVSATATLRRVADCRELAAVRPFLVRAFSCLLASWKIWSRGTLGGNLCAALPAGAPSAAALTLGGTAVIWCPDGSTRRVPLAGFVRAPGRTALRPGELLRAVDVPAGALAARYALRRTSLSEYGRSASLVTGRRDADGTTTLVLTAATPAPVVWTPDRPPTPEAAAELVAAVEHWYDDPQGSPRWRRHVSIAAARAVAAELASDPGTASGTGTDSEECA